VAVVLRLMYMSGVMEALKMRGMTPGVMPLSAQNRHPPTHRLFEL